MLAHKSVNIAAMQLYRAGRGGNSVMVLECDQEVPEEGINWLRHAEGVDSQKYVASAEEAARQMEQRYNLGAATVVDYNTALDALVEAQVQLLQAKYEYIFKTEIIKFYLDSNKK